MYSVVLMMALTGGADAPEFGHRGGCHGGCSGSSYGCSGSSYGCSGSSYGCSGSCHGKRHHKQRHHKRRHGCHGGGYGCTGGGCYGSGAGYGGCYGSGAGYGGCYGSGAGYGGCYGSGAGYGGCYGSGAGYGSGVGCSGGDSYIPPIIEQKGDGKGKKTKTAAPATVIVSLPADAKLTIDGAPTKATEAKRLFASPALPMGQDYYYTFKATIVRKGRPISAEQRVRVRAGEQTPITFDFSTTGVALNK